MIQTRKPPHDDRDALQTILQVTGYYVAGRLAQTGEWEGVDEPMNPIRVAENVGILTWQPCCWSSSGPRSAPTT